MNFSDPHIAIITPCYNESRIATGFLDRMEHVLAPLPFTFCVIVVNDGSTDDTLALLKDFRFKTDNICLNILDLGANVGHQAAIYQGFLYAQTLTTDHFIVMDADGEDAPSAIPELLMHREADVVNVIRGKRRESLLFRSLYRAYKILFRAVTGKQMNFGNYCLINRNVLERAISVSFTHFPVFLSKQKGIVRSIIAEREERIGGRSKMGFAKLFHHAFRSFAEYRTDAHRIIAPAYKTIIPEQGISNANYTV